MCPLMSIINKTSHNINLDKLLYLRPPNRPSADWNFINAVSQRPIFSGDQNKLIGLVKHMLHQISKHFHSRTAN